MISNLTHREHYRLYGYLTHAQLEELLGIAETIESGLIENVRCHIEEAVPCLPGEGFLQVHIAALEAITKSLRGPNRAAMSGLVESLTDFAMRKELDGKQGCDELRQALDLIAKVNI